ncbi:MAG TPA: DUF1697 domain-containing protein, partial [Methanobacterium sp.]|nr:DUF1697 domain-containing protein [Methanobacterium sp.]
SGNIIFQSPQENITVLEELIERKIEEKYDFHVPIIIRTVDELKEIIINNPFTGKEFKNIYTTFLKDKPVKLPLKQIDDRKDESEEFYFRGREIYLFLPHGYGRTKISNNFFESKLKLPATTRNWRTVNKLHELAKDYE